jgi:TonB family protein
MESLPLYAGGGYTELGFGIHPHRLWDFHAGIGGGPYDGLGFAIMADYRVRQNWALAARARLGESGGEPQSGVGLGLTYVSRPPVQPQPGRGRRERIESGWGLGPRRKPPADPPLEPSGSEAAKPQRWPEYGSYQYVDSLPVLVSRIEPDYSDSLREAGVGGTVRLALLIGRDGEVIDARVMKSIPALDDAALAGVRQWRFRPAICGGKPLAYWLVVPVTFGSE